MNKLNDKIKLLKANKKAMNIQGIDGFELIFEDERFSCAKDFFREINKYNTDVTPFDEYKYNSGGDVLKWILSCVLTYGFCSGSIYAKIDYDFFILCNVVNIEAFLNSFMEKNFGDIFLILPNLENVLYFSFDEYEVKFFLKVK